MRFMKQIFNNFNTNLTSGELSTIFLDKNIDSSPQLNSLNHGSDRKNKGECGLRGEVKLREKTSVGRNESNNHR